jgi:hypothetical protein
MQRRDLMPVWLRMVSLVILASSWNPPSAFSADKKAQPDFPWYVPQATWAETMLASRAAYLAWQQSGQPSGDATAQPFVSEPIAGDGPGQAVSVHVAGCQWLRLVTVLEQGGGNCHIWGDARLIAKDGTVTRLDSLKPASVIVGWGELLTGRNWQDRSLRIGQREFEHGVWVHSNSDVCYRLDGRYERFEAWAGMDADRAVGLARFKVLFTGPEVLPEIWKRIARDFPLHTRWFREDASRRELEWFGAASVTTTDQTMINRVLSQLPAGSDPLRRQFDELRRDRVASDDPRWLNLYERACRMRESSGPLKQIWIAELQRLVAREFEPLLDPQAVADDAEWEALAARVKTISERIGSGYPFEIAGFGASIDSLGRALPGRFTGAAVLQARVAQRTPEWQQVLAGAARGDAAALDALRGIADEVRAARRDTLLALRGMAELLDSPTGALLETDWQQQFETLRYDLANRGHFDRVAPETYRTQALIQSEDRDPVDVVLRRTAALYDDLLRTPAAEKLAGLLPQWVALRAASDAITVDDVPARYVLFADVCRLRRAIAFSNPLLNFDEIVFIKRHRALFNHMCDQYYGMAATPGGGLYILSDAFGSNPSVRDVLADSVVQQGRLKGQKLSGGPNTPPAWRFDGMGNLHGQPHEGGSFLSPDLSYDGRSILFAYVECTGDTQHRHHTDPAQGHWHEGRCYHIFKVNVDGSGLEQLTDGTWNDFDPCWLPNGRIAFISERRGGYLRCGRVCPTYTLFDMAADGSDITCLSFHETNEWHPSVTNEGLIVWTRWDYVDRHGCTAHKPWTTTLDGRDPRPVHGNYSIRSSRPDMETDVRAIPGSNKLIAVASPHHGQSYGSLILIDPAVPDDDAMGPVQRITPEVGFPETQGGSQVYGTPWALSEDYYLCVYDASMQQGVGFQGGGFVAGNYGVYLADAFGNKELLYRDPEIGCLTPMPLQARPCPSVAPQLAQRGAETNPAARHTAQETFESAEGTVAVMNVYDSLKPWPEGTQIRQVRVLQVLPMSVPSGGPPHETGVRVVTAGDSVVPVRYVLGTAPVEADGSAHFVVPANREIFFQALDEKGLAVQSMRSATHLQTGDRLVCAGCHEPKHRVALNTQSLPLALQRPPSRLEPDVDGSNPFSYPRLVQPVLDRHCVQCHQEKSDVAPNLGREPIVRNWYASYNSLVTKYGFYDYGDPYRTTPGRFGARASKLYELLQKGHHDVKLSDEEMYRITLWLDCASMFYGVYEREGGKAQLQGEIAKPTLE